MIRNSHNLFAKMEEIGDICSMPLKRMREAATYIQDQMEKGLKGEPSDLKMLPSFVDSVCDGTQHDWYVNRRKGTRIRHGT